MNISLNMLKSDLSRMFKSTEFLIGVFLVFSLLWLGIWDDFKVSSADVVYYYSLSHFTMYSQISLALSASLCAIYFTNDWNTNTFWYNIVRIGTKNYCRTRCLSTIISGGLVVILGEILFIISLSLQRQWFDMQKSGTRLVTLALESTIVKHDIFLYFLFSLIVVFLRNATFSMIAFYISTFITNRFVTVVSPIISWFILSFIGSKIKLPCLINLTSLYSGFCNFGNAQLWLIYVNIISTALYFILVKLIYINLCKRKEK